MFCTPAEVVRATGPAALFRGDIIGTVGRVLGLTAALTIMMHELTDAPWTVYTLGALIGLFVGVAGSACGRYLAIHSWLAVRGRLPWRLMTFLQDAHDRGVLRRVGAVYEFRHALLRDRLAAGSAMGKGVPTYRD
jgi:hypothetical protein